MWSGRQAQRDIQRFCSRGWDVDVERASGSATSSTLFSSPFTLEQELQAQHDAAPSTLPRDWRSVAGCGGHNVAEERDR
jgi:hypothetical protein